MIRNDYFAVKNSIVDRDDLTIYEKMCCIVLARYAGKEEYDNLLTSDIIAIKMGTDIASAKKALLGLIEKGLIGFEGLSQDMAEEAVDAVDNDEHTSEVEPELKSNSKESIHMEISEAEESKPLTIDEFKERLKGYGIVKGEKPPKEEQVIKQPSLWDELERRDEESESSIGESVDYKTDQIESYEEDEDINIEEYKNSELLSSLSDEAKYHLGLLDDDAYGIKQSIATSQSVKHLSYDNSKTSKEEQKRYSTNKSTDKEKYHSLIDQVYEIIDENINEREARIILSFADNDIDRIKEKYRIAKLSQINDKIEVLINELQRKERKPVVIRQVDPNGEEINPNQDQSEIKIDEDAPPMGQINMANLNKMKLYSQFSKNNNPNLK